MTEDGIGVDISKSHLDVHWLEPGLAARFENTARGFRDLIRWLPRTAVARIVFEPTGPYHKAFEAALGNSLPLVKVNPLQARRFAEAQGTRARTDAVDARMLDRMGSAHLSAAPPRAERGHASDAANAVCAQLGLPPGSITARLDHRPARSPTELRRLTFRRTST